MNTIKEILSINEQELERGLAGTAGSWHAKYSKSAWVYVGNLDHSLTEGDVICVLSQFGEVEDLHLVREEDTGKSRGFAFCKYEDARSCALAVDNFCGVELCGRLMRVDHVENYRLPKHLMEKEEGIIDAAKQGPGHAYSGQELANEYSLEQGQDLFAPAPPPAVRQKGKAARESDNSESKEAKQKRKEERQLKRAEKQERRRRREQKRTKKEERKRGKRARKMRESDDESSDDDRRSKKRKRHDSRSDSQSSDQS